jgi:O-acetyl-ADP-ribose deacetylase (regulator of RNase III)
VLFYKRTNLLDATTQTLVNTVNCVGVMGKGIAKEFKGRNPEMFESYRRICDQKALEPGKLWLWRGAPSWILNFPTKRHWRHPSRIEWIEAGLQKFVSTYEAQGISEVSFPKLGCGNGNLDWNDVRPLMEGYLSNLKIPVYIHDYSVDIGLPEHLENLAERVNDSAPKDLSFSSFMKILKMISDLAPSIETDRERTFAPKFSDNSLQLKIGTTTWTLQEDDLRGIWLSLMNGMVTKEKAGWTAVETGESMLTILQMIPSVRGVEILRQGRTEPELAVELKPYVAGSADIPFVAQQIDLPWH